MTRTERMKLAIQQRQAAEQMAAAEKRAEAKTPPAAKKHKPTGPDVGTHACGHPIKLAVMKKMPCEQCRGERRKKSLEKYIAEKPKRFDKRHGARDRLPAGAEFVGLRWDGTAWTGALVVGGTTVSGTGHGLFGLLAALDDQYRATLQQPEGKS